MPGGDDPSLIVNDQPQETYPKFYKPPVAPRLTPLEERAIACFVQFRRAYHNAPLYTHRHINSEFLSAKDPVLPRHGRSQINTRYGIKNRATIDPFLSVPMYSHRFVDDTRTLPKLRNTRPWVKDLFPEELWATLDGMDTSGAKGGFQTEGNASRDTRRRLDGEDNDDGNDPYGDEYDDEDIFGGGRSSQRRHENETEEERQARIEGAGKDADIEDGDAGDADEDDEEEMEVEDDDYDSAEDDDDGGDYNAEAYFDNGDDDDFGDDDGVGESAMDF